MSAEIAQRDGFVISTGVAGLDFAVVARILGESYWAEGIPADRLKLSFENALAFGLYGPDGAMAGFARVVTDGVRMAYLSDLVVLDEFRGRGLGTWMMEEIFAHQDLGQVDRWLLMTRDAQAFYRRFGFEDVADSPVMLREATRK